MGSQLHVFDKEDAQPHRFRNPSRRYPARRMTPRDEIKQTDSTKPETDAGHRFRVPWDAFPCAALGSQGQRLGGAATKPPGNPEGHGFPTAEPAPVRLSSARNCLDTSRREVSNRVNQHKRRVAGCPGLKGEFPANFKRSRRRWLRL